MKQCGSAFGFTHFVGNSLDPFDSASCFLLISCLAFFRESQDVGHTSYPWEGLSCIQYGPSQMYLPLESRHSQGSSKMPPQLERPTYCWSRWVERTSMIPCYNSMISIYKKNRTSVDTYVDCSAL